MFDNILKNDKNIDLKMIMERKKTLVGMAEGCIKNAFTLDKINAATYNLQD